MSSDQALVEAQRRRFHPVRFTFGLVTLVLAGSLTAFLRSSDLLSGSDSASWILFGFLVIVLALLWITAAFLLMASWGTIDWVENEKEPSWIERYWGFEIALAGLLAVIVATGALLVVPIALAVAGILWVVSLLALLASWMNAAGASGGTGSEDATGQSKIKLGAAAVAAILTTVVLVYLLADTAFF